MSSTKRAITLPPEIILPCSDDFQTKSLSNSTNEKTFSPDTLLCKKAKREKEKTNRDSCSICRDGGELLLCDNCPKSFHVSCLKLKPEDIPEGAWYCATCLVKIRKKSEMNKNEGEDKENERIRLLKNEKRRLWRLKRKAEMNKKKMSYVNDNNSNSKLKDDNECDEDKFKGRKNEINVDEEGNSEKKYKLVLDNSNICVNVTYVVAKEDERNGHDGNGSYKGNKCLPVNQIQGSNVNNNNNSNNTKTLSLPVLFPIPYKSLLSLSNNMNEMTNVIQSNTMHHKVFNSYLQYINTNNNENNDIEMTTNTSQYTNIPNNTHTSTLISILKTPNSINKLNNEFIYPNVNYPLYNTLTRSYWNELLLKKNPKHFPKYPIDDYELYNYPDIHGINEYNINKPTGNNLTTIPQHRFAKLIQIFDFIQTFSHKLAITRFSLYDLYTDLTLSETDSERSYCLLYTIYISLIQLILTHISSLDSNDLLNNNDHTLLTLRKKTDKMTNTEFTEYIELSWLELMYIVLSSSTFSSLNLASSSVISRLNNEILTLTQFNCEFSYDDKVCLLQSLINICYDTDIIRELIRSEHEKRDELKKSKKDLEEEMKVIDARKRILERQEKFTQPYLKVETLTKKLNTLSEDNQHLTRMQLSKLRKEVEHEREQFKSVIKEMECINGRKVDIMNKIEKLQNEMYEIPTIGKKCVGVDGRGYKYFFFPWENEKIFMKCGKEWKELGDERDIKELIERLSEKGVKEKALKSKLKKIYPKRMNMGRYHYKRNWNNGNNGGNSSCNNDNGYIHIKVKQKVIEDDDDEDYSHKSDN